MRVHACIVATSLIVLFTMLYAVRERTEEIGVLKAIGFSNGSIMSQFMLEGMVMTLIAGVIGVAIGSLGAPILSSVLLPTVNPSINPDGKRTFIPGLALPETVVATVDPTMMVIAFGLALLLGALGTFYPA